MRRKLTLSAVCFGFGVLASFTAALAGLPPDSGGVRIAQFHFKEATRLDYNSFLFATNRDIDRVALQALQLKSNSETIILPRGFDIDKIFLSTMSLQVALGRIEVDYPADRQIGEQTYSRWPSEDNPFQTFSVARLNVFNRIEDWLQSAPSRYQPVNRDIDLLYIHGFNVPFSTAVAETAQLKEDLKFDGPMMLFSWPSNLGLSAPSYREVGKREQLTTAQFSQVLEEVDRFRFDNGSPDGGRIVEQVLAHSMGAKLILDTLSTIRKDAVDEKHPDGMVKLHTLILAAADVSRKLFRERDLPVISEYADKTFIICSDFDIALGFSADVNATIAQDEFGESIGVSDERLGQCFDYDNAFKAEISSGSIRWYKFAGPSSDFIGHSYFTNDPKTLMEMKNQLNASPD
jgi:Alpha/beta hydrolase of unknown function (DUF900)